MMIFFERSEVENLTRLSFLSENFGGLSKICRFAPIFLIKIARFRDGH